jgi:hypothetical protein
MKSYISLALSLVCVGGVCAMEHGMPVYVNVKYYKTYNDAYNDRNEQRTTITITPETTIYDIQGELRRRIGPGDLRVAATQIGEEPEYETVPLFEQYGNNPEMATAALTRDYSFWPK